jgi:hypothetical protein
MTTFMKTVEYIEFGPLGEHPCDVFYDYQPKECGTLEYPGCDEGVEIFAIYLVLGGIKLEVSKYYSRGDLEDLETYILENMEHNIQEEY